jgi:hypothetical protein
LLRKEGEVRVPHIAEQQLRASVEDKNSHPA